MRVVAFTGLPGAGKTDAVEEAKRRGLPIVVMGDFVRAETQARGLSPADANLGKTAQDMRQRLGADIMAVKTIDEIQRKHREARLVVVDGVRSLEEIQTLRARLGPSFQLVSIDAPEAERFARLRGRGRSDDSHSVDDMRARDEREKAWGLLEAISQADAHLGNAGSLAEFRRQVSALFDRLTAPAEVGSATGFARAGPGTPP